MKKYKREEIKEEEFERVTNGKSELHQLNNTPHKIFVSKYKDKGVDIFFYKDKDYTVISDRMSSLVWHGRKGDFPNLDKVKYIYSSYDNEFYTPADFSKIIKGVYFGRKARVKPIKI